MPANELPEGFPPYTLNLRVSPLHTAYIRTYPHILIFQTTDNAPHAIHTNSIDPQIRNDPQHRASKDLRCGIDEHSCHMWYVGATCHSDKNDMHF